MSLICLYFKSYFVYQFSDGAGGKAFPRSSRRRETAGTSTPKYDPVRKQTAQKGKAFDKRPRPRGPYMECRKEGPQVETAHICHNFKLSWISFIVN